MNQAVSKSYVIIISSLKNDLKLVFLPVIVPAPSVHTSQQFFSNLNLQFLKFLHVHAYNFDNNS